jgi:putative colanic acid biosynthesis acetyltransferase WcaF
VTDGANNHEPVHRITDPHKNILLVRGSTWSERVRETLWEMIGQPIMRFSFHNWYWFRNALLRLFGAKLAMSARIRPSVKISHPWRLSVGEYTAIGDRAILFCLGPISIGDHCTVSQYAHLCAAGHQYTNPEMPLIAEPIVIGNDVWIAADVFVGPGVTIGDETVIGARSTVPKSLPAESICAGEPARRIGKRILIKTELTA